MVEAACGGSSLQGCCEWWDYFKARLHQRTLTCAVCDTGAMPNSVLMRIVQVAE